MFGLALFGIGGAAPDLRDREHAFNAAGARPFGSQFPCKSGYGQAHHPFNLWGPHGTCGRGGATPPEFPSPGPGVREPHARPRPVAQDSEVVVSDVSILLPLLVN